jgi:phosphatidylcholine synthase
MCSDFTPTVPIHKAETLAPSAHPYDEPPSTRSIAVAWSVHAYTALGSVAAFAATVAIIEGAYRAAFLWMLAATLVDSTDGVFARLARVKARLPAFDGARLDDIVDYLTYVFVPMLLLYHAGNVPRNVWGLAIVSAVLLSSAYGFVSSDAKTNDFFFTGFPSYWNITALYLHAVAMRPAVNALILMALVALVFVRTGYVYPSRTPVLRTLTLGLGGLWAVMLLAIVLALPAVPRWLLIGSFFFPVYYFVLSFVLHSRRWKT